MYGLDLIGREDEAGQYRTYHDDRHRSTVALTDKNAQVTDTYTYGHYGEALGHQGETKQPFRYNGRDGVMTDANGLYYMRARYYNPEIKRFVNRDVVAGAIDYAQTLNRYAYVNGNPISYVDPFGLERIKSTYVAGIGIGFVNQFKPGTERYNTWNHTIEIDAGEMPGGRKVPNIRGDRSYQTLINAFNGKETGNAKRSQYSEDRKSQGRSTGSVFNDVQKARDAGILIQDDGKWIVGGFKESNGQGRHRNKFNNLEISLTIY